MRAAGENGRDLMVRLLYGIRTTVEISLGAVLLTLAFAVPLALGSGYFRGRTDAVISRILDLIWSFPALLLGVMLGTALTLRGASIGPIEIEAGSRMIPIAVIVLESALSFLGAGVDPPEPSLGSLIDAGVDTVRLSPHLLLVPCLALVLVVLGIGGLAEGLRRALDPRGELPRGLARDR